MGVKEFLSKVLDTAGRPLDLQKVDRRPRTAVDVSLWTFKVAHSYSSMLADESHLTNHGRAELVANNRLEDSEETKISMFVAECVQQILSRLEELSKVADVLVVFDGATPPAKQKEVQNRHDRRRQAMEGRDKPVVVVEAAAARGGAESDAMEGVQVDEDSGDGTSADENGTEKGATGRAYQAATEEANQERIQSFRRAGGGKHFGRILNHLMLGCRERKIPYMVAPYEADSQLAFLAQEGHVDMLITEDSDMLTFGLPVPIMYKYRDMKGIILRYSDLSAARDIDLFDFTPPMMACLFVASGGDYCRKLKGIGLKTACDLVRDAFYGKHGLPPLRRLLDKLFKESWEELSIPEKEEYRHDFCRAVLMMQHAIVYDPIEGACVTMGDEDAELIRYDLYADLCLNPEARARVVGHMIPPPIATMIAEGWVNPRSMSPRHVFALPDKMSKELSKYRDSLSKLDDDEDSDEEDGPETQLPPNF